MCMYMIRNQPSETDQPHNQPCASYGVALLTFQTSQDMT